MTSQEQQMIAGLIDRVGKAELPEKDPEAEQMIQSGLGRNPDALYILSQTVLVQQYALDGATRQLADLKTQLAAAQSQNQGQAQPRHATSFLGSIFGSHDEARPAPPPPSPAYNQQPPSPPPYTPVQGYPAGGVAPQGYAPAYGAPPAAGGGFLRSALQTATGVAAGALAFQGVESLMHGFGGGGMGFGGGGNSRPEEVINNYYGDDAREQHDDRSGLSSDIEDRRDDGGFFNAGKDASSDSDDGDRFAGSGDDGSSGLDDTADNDQSDSDSGDDNGGGDFSGDDSSFS